MSDSRPKKSWANNLLEEATNAVQLEACGGWQHESPYKEDLELLRVSGDLRLDGTIMREVFMAKRVNALTW